MLKLLEFVIIFHCNVHIFIFRYVSQSELKPNYSKKQGGSALSILPTRNKSEIICLKKNCFSFLRLEEVFSELRSKFQILTHPLTSMTLKDPDWLTAEKLPNNIKQRTYLIFCKDNFSVTVGSYCLPKIRKADWL